MRVCAFTYVEICTGYVNCSDRKLAKLRTEPMGLEFSPRDTCFHHHLHAKQFHLPTASTLPCSLQLLFILVSLCFSTFYPFFKLCPEKIKLVGVILEISSLCQGSSAILGLGSPITRIASRSWVTYLIFWNVLISVWTFWDLTFLSEMLGFLSKNFGLS